MKNNIWFFGFVLVSVAVHFVLLVVVFDKPEKEPNETKFSEVVIKLGINRNYDQAKSVARKQSLAVAKISQKTVKNTEKTEQIAQKPRKIIQEKKVKKAEKLPKNSKVVSLNKNVVKKNDKKPVPSDKTTNTNTSVASAKPKGEQKTAQKKVEEKKFIRIVEKASEEIKLEKHEKPKSEKNILPKEGSYLGNNISDTAQNIVDYEEIVGLYIDEFRVYPQVAYKQGLQGVGKVFVKYDRQGNLLLYKITQSTGHAILDDEMMRAVVMSNPIKPFPDDYFPELKTFSYEYPMKFVQ